MKRELTDMEKLLVKLYFDEHPTEEKQERVKPIISEVGEWPRDRFEIALAEAHLKGFAEPPKG